VKHTNFGEELIMTDSAERTNKILRKDEESTLDIGHNQINWGLEGGMSRVNG
jgi:hypothetical protein